MGGWGANLTPRTTGTTKDAIQEGVGSRLTIDARGDNNRSLCVKTTEWGWTGGGYPFDDNGIVKGRIKERRKAV